MCDRVFLPAKSQHLVAGYQGNMGQSTHRRLDRLQIVSVGSLRDQSTTQFHRWRSTNKILSCDVITIYQRVQFSWRIKKDSKWCTEYICFLIADRNWLDFSSQFQGLLKEMKCAIGFPTAPQSQWFDITYSVFQEIFNLGQGRPTVLWQPWTPISSDLQPLSTGL